MELFLNGTTYTLKQINAERCKLFVDCMTQFSHISDLSDESLVDVQIELVKKHNKRMKIAEIRKKYLTEYKNAVISLIWNFIKPDDKKTLKSSLNVKIADEEILKFVESVSADVKFYANYVKSKGKTGKNLDKCEIYAHLSRFYGWSFEECDEMSQIELAKALENSLSLYHKENVNEINLHALVGAYSQGSKKALAQINKMNAEAKRKDITKNASQFKDNTLSRETLEKLMKQQGSGNG